MKCQEVMEYMQRQLDLDLTDSEQQLLDAHLETCASCRIMMERLQRLTSELSSLPKVLPPVSLVDAILPKLEEIDRARQLTVTGAVQPATADQSENARLANRRNHRANRISYKVLGGVVAAGLLLGIAIVNLDQDSMQVADQAMSGSSSYSQANMALMNVATSSADSSESEEAEAADDASGFAALPVYEIYDQSSSYVADSEDKPVGILAPSSGRQGFLGIPVTGGKSGDQAVGTEEPAAELGSTSKSAAGLTGEKSESFEVDINLEEIGTIMGGIEGSVGLASPEGTYSVFIENGSVVILDSNHERTYISQSFGDAEVYGLEWMDDSRLTFKVLTDEGEQAYYIDLDDRSEGRL